MTCDRVDVAGLDLRISLKNLSSYSRVAKGLRPVIVRSAKKAENIRKLIVTSGADSEGQRSV